MYAVEEPSQFSVGQTAQRLNCSIMEKPHAGLDNCLNILLSCFRKRMSGLDLLIEEGREQQCKVFVHILTLKLHTYSVETACGIL